jgi:pyruvate ferredoxin oxidoreductase delta subunit
LCMQCWAFCPDNVISRTAPPKIDLEYCKGCGICAAVCPNHAIDIVPENENTKLNVPEGSSCDC